jgi:hypothetical protein
MADIKSYIIAQFKYFFEGAFTSPSRIEKLGTEVCAKHQELYLKLLKELEGQEWPLNINEVFCRYEACKKTIGLYEAHEGRYVGWMLIDIPPKMRSNIIEYIQWLQDKKEKWYKDYD